MKIFLLFLNSTLNCSIVSQHLLLFKESPQPLDVRLLVPFVFPIAIFKMAVGFALESAWADKSHDCCVKIFERSRISGSTFQDGAWVGPRSKQVGLHLFPSLLAYAGIHLWL